MGVRRNSFELHFFLAPGALGTQIPQVPPPAMPTAVPEDTAMPAVAVPTWAAMPLPAAPAAPAELAAPAAPAAPAAQLLMKIPKLVPQELLPPK